jgi:hypothetical protein
VDVRSSHDRAALPARPIERVQKVLLGRNRGLRLTLPQDEFAFDPQELGDAPPLLVAIGSPERFVDYREPFGSHRKLLSSKAMVVNVAEKSEQDSGRQG